MFAAADQIMGWSGWWRSMPSLCAWGVQRGLQGGYSGLGWWQERWGGELWLKGAFPLKCLPACTPANTITSLVGSASWTNEGLCVEGRVFDVLGSLCSLSRSPSLPVPHQKWKGSWEADVLRHVFIQSTLYSPLLHNLFVLSFCIPAVARIFLSTFVSN